MHYEFDAHSRLIAVRQRREGDQLPDAGQADCGCFVVSPARVLPCAAAAPLVEPARRTAQPRAEFPPGASLHRPRSARRRRRRRNAGRHDRPELDLRPRASGSSDDAAGPPTGMSRMRVGLAAGRPRRARWPSAISRPRWRLARTVVDVLLFAAGIRGVHRRRLAAGALGRRRRGPIRSSRAILALFLGYIVGALLFCLLRLVHLTLAVDCARRVARRWRGCCIGSCRAMLRQCCPCRRSPGAITWRWPCLLTLVLLVVGPVFANIGKPMPLGLAYRAYFTADLFAHMSVVAELAHGTIPPLNPYLPTEPLPYYWAYFSLPGGVQGSSTEPAGRSRNLADRPRDGAGASSGSGTSRCGRSAASAMAAAWAWGIAIAAPSFEGLELLWLEVSRGACRSRISASSTSTGSRGGGGICRPSTAFIGSSGTRRSTQRR